MIVDRQQIQRKKSLAQSCLEYVSLECGSHEGKIYEAYALPPELADPGYYIGLFTIQIVFLQ